MTEPAAAETILRLGGEGGGYEILGRRTVEGGWQFRVNTSDVTPELIDEAPIRRRGAWVPTLADALAKINRAWPRLYPRVVHLEFRDLILDEVKRRVFEGGAPSEDARGSYQRWQRACGVEGLDDEDD